MLTEANAAVPAQQSVVVAGRTQLFGLLVAVHGLANPFVSERCASRSSLDRAGLTATLQDNAAVIQAFVLTVQFRQHLFGLLMQAMRHLRQWKFRGRPIGIALSRVVVLFTIPVAKADVPAL